MNETKFTPGPWIACPDVGLQIPVASVAKEGLKRNVSHVAGIRNGEGAANAHLIAAAPELYEACEILFKVTTGMMKQITHSGFEPGSPLGKCEAALAKARGEA